MFATRLSNVFVIGEGNKPMVSLPKRKGIKMSILEEYDASVSCKPMRARTTARECVRSERRVRE